MKVSNSAAPRGLSLSHRGFVGGISAYVRDPQKLAKEVRIKKLGHVPVYVVFCLG
jgi:hypothetical protein